MNKLVVLGSVNADHVLQVPSFPRPGETLHGRNYQVIPGGKGANQAVAAVRSGARVSFVANIGQDDFGDAALLRFKHEGIDTRFVVRDRFIPSGVALIMVGEKGRNLISVAAGSNERLAKAHIKRAKVAFNRARFCLIQLETPLSTVEEALRMCKRHKVYAVLDPAPSRRLAKSFLRLVDLITPNEFELAELTGMPVKTKNNIECAGKALLQTGVGEVIVTCGERGACYLSNERVVWFSTPKVKAVDTVGAGDCFNGSLASALSDGLVMDDAIRYAISSADRSVTLKGAQTSYHKLKPSRWN